MNTALAIAHVAAGATLLTSALEKLRSPAEFRQVLYQLGFVTGVAKWWLAVSISELLTVILLVAPVPRQLPAGALLLLGVVFATAGIRALRSAAPIHCGCFGALGRQRLGRPQLYALPVWIIIAIAVVSWEPANNDERMLLVVGVLLVTLAVLTYTLGRATMRARTDRIAIAEMSLVSGSGESAADPKVGVARKG